MANKNVFRRQTASITLSKIEDTMSRCSRKDHDGVTVVRPQNQRQLFQGQMKSPACLTPQARDSAAMVLSPGRWADVSMDVP